MKLVWASVAVALLFVLGLAVSAQGRRPAPSTQGAEVTLKGVLMHQICCTRSMTKDQAKQAETTPVLFVVEGTPEVAAIVNDIMKEYYVGDSIDGDQARHIQDEFEKRLKYYVAPTDLTANKPNLARWGNPAMAITGVVSEKDGIKWITPTKIEGTKLKYPGKMLQVDKPLAMPGPTPLVLKVSDTLSLNCILLPAGKYFSGVAFYATYDNGATVRYDDDFPYMITLTKPFYLAESPVTQEMYEAVMGTNPSDQKGPQVPVMRASATDIAKFCQILSEKNGRTVRLPTQAEREYAARVGTSNPSTVNSKYTDQLNLAADGKSLLPVKSRKPNAWGLYDMFNGAWEMIGDRRQFSREDAVDPFYPDGKAQKNHNAMGRNGFSWTCTREGVGDGTGTGYTLTIFRVAVDATSGEIAAMGKSGKN